MPDSTASVPLTVATRLWFAWTLLWNALVLTAMWPAWITALRLSRTSRTFSWWLRLWARIVLGGCGFRIQGIWEVRPDGPVVYVANHQAMLDIPALALAIPDPFVFVARSELRRLPLVGSILAHSLCVFVDRRAPGGTDAALDEAAERLGEGHSVLFFPEGTRSYDGALKDFYPGAFRLAAMAGVPVVPVGIGGTHRLLNERQKTARPGRVPIRLGAPLGPEADAPALARDAHAAVERLISGA